MSVSGVRYDINFVIPTERSDEGSRDLSHTFEMTVKQVQDDSEVGSRCQLAECAMIQTCHPDRA